MRSIPLAVALVITGAAAGAQGRFTLEGADRSYAASGEAIHCAVRLYDGASRNTIQIRVDHPDFAVTLNGEGFPGAGAYPIDRARRPLFIVSGVVDRRGRTAAFSATGGKVTLSTLGGSSVSGRAEIRATLPGAVESTLHASFDVPTDLCDVRGTVVASASTDGAMASAALQATPSGPAIDRSVLATAEAPAVTAVVRARTVQSGYVGDSVDIVGEKLNTVSQVTFNGVRSTYTVVSPGLIRTTVPTSATTGPLQLMPASGNAVKAADFTVLSSGPGATSGGTDPTYPLSVSYDLSDCAGSVTDGSPSFVVTGSEAGSVTAVKVDGVTATDLRRKDGRLFFNVDYRKLSQGAVELTVPGGVRQAKLTVLTPRVTRLMSMPNGIDSVFMRDSAFHIWGYNLSIPGNQCTMAPRVLLGARPLDVRVISGQDLEIRVPKISGYYDLYNQKLSVRVPFIGDAEWPVALHEVPQVTSLDEFQAGVGTAAAFIPDARDGDTIAVFGRALHNIQKAYVGGLAVPIVARTPTRLDLALPFRGIEVSGTLPMSLTFQGLGSNALDWFGPGLKVNVRPRRSITSVSADSAAPGMQVAIQGHGLWDPPAGVSQDWTPAVDFGGTRATQVSKLGSAPGVVAVVPRDARSGRVTVESVTGPSIRIYKLAPTASLSAMSAAAGESIDVTLEHADAISAVSFGAVSAATWRFKTIGDSYGWTRVFTVVVPTGAATGDVVVTTPDGVAKVSGFTVKP